MVIGGEYSIEGRIACDLLKCLDGGICILQIDVYAVSRLVDQGVFALRRDLDLDAKAGSRIQISSDTVAAVWCDQKEAFGGQ
jgi:hypothetical protein